jgi:Holliday junction resolvasome RuvABC endonuclease subunit
VKMLAIDPSLTATGFVVLDLAADHREVVLAMEFVETKPDAKSVHVYQADQDGARCDQIARKALQLVRTYEPDVIACEAPAGSQHANAAKALALAYGTLRGAMAAEGRTLVMIQAHHAKIAATGSKAASKGDVLEAMQRRFGVGLTGSKPRKEAIADALSVACAAMGEATIEALRRRSA